MVLAVRCPSAACRKYMLVEGHERGKTVRCLICRHAISVPAADGDTTTLAPAPIPSAVPVARVAPRPAARPAPPPAAAPTDDELLGLE